MESPKEINVSPEQLMGMFESEKRKMEQLNQNFNAMQNLINETRGAIDAVKALSKAKKGQSIKVPLGAGTLIDVNFDNLEKVQLSLPGNILADYTPEDGLKELEQRLAAVEKNMETLQKEMQTTFQNMDNLSKAVRKISAGKQ